MEDNKVAGETRVFVLATPSPQIAGSKLDWNYITKMFTQFGGRVHEDCSGAALGNQHGELIIQASLKDYAQVPQLINELRRVGLNASVYPWSNPTESVKSFSQPITTSASR